MKANKINIEGLRRLSGDDEMFVSEILRLYTDRAATDIEELESARTIQDWGTVRFVVHRMRSAAVPLGLKDLVVLLKKVEMKLKDDVLEGVDGALDKIIILTKEALEDARHQLSLTSA